MKLVKLVLQDHFYLFSSVIYKFSQVDLGFKFHFILCSLSSFSIARFTRRPQSRKTRRRFPLQNHSICFDIQKKLGDKVVSPYSEYVYSIRNWKSKAPIELISIESKYSLLMVPNIICIMYNNFWSFECDCPRLDSKLDENDFLKLSSNLQNSGKEWETQFLTPSPSLHILGN